MDLVQNAVVAIIVGGLSAYVSGRLAVRRALEEFKGVRAAERALDWHEQMSEALTDHMHALVGLVTFPDRDMPEHAEFLAALIEANQRVGHHMARSMLFASRDAISVLESVDFDPLTREITRLSASPGGSFPSGEALKHVREIDRARGLLADHYRASLGIGRLEAGE